jgi:hypothetical protein
MLLLCFVGDSLFHVKHFSRLKIDDKYNFGDSIVKFLSEVLYDYDFYSVKKIVISSDSLSFTTSRIIYSIAKGVYLINNYSQIIFVSCTLAYLSIVFQCGYINLLFALNADMYLHKSDILSNTAIIT